MPVCGVQGERRTARALIEEVRLQHGAPKRVAAFGRRLAEVGVRKEDVPARPARELQDDGHALYLQPDGAERAVELQPEFLPQFAYKGLVFHSFWPFSFC